MFSSYKLAWNATNKVIDTIELWINTRDQVNLPQDLVEHVI